MWRARVRAPAGGDRRRQQARDSRWSRGHVGGERHQQRHPTLRRACARPRRQAAGHAPRISRKGERADGGARQWRDGARAGFRGCLRSRAMHPNASLLPAVFARRRRVRPSRAVSSLPPWPSAATWRAAWRCRCGNRWRAAAGIPRRFWGPTGRPRRARSAAAWADGDRRRVFAAALSKHLSRRNQTQPGVGDTRGSRSFPCQAAVLSVLLAERGVKGFEHPLEGARVFSVYLPRAGTIRRRYSRTGRALLDRAAEFQEMALLPGHPCVHRGGADAAWPARLSRGSSRPCARQGDALQRMLCEPTAQKRAPQTMIDAKFSLPFTVAAALIHDEVTLGSFTPATLSDADCWPRGTGRVRTLATVEPEPPRPAICPSAQRRTGAAPPGRSSAGRSGRPMDDAALDAKFIDCAARAAVPLSAAKSHQLAERILALEQEPDVGALLTSTRRPSRRDRAAARPAGDRRNCAGR